MSSNLATWLFESFPIVSIEASLTVFHKLFKVDIRLVDIFDIFLLWKISMKKDQTYMKFK